jgi:predicted acylesterase/phospholipase RssA
LEKSKKIAGVGVLKCLVKLNRHKQALRHFTELLHKHYAFYSQLAEFWLYAGMASCARYLLHEARFYFTRADEIASTRLTRSQLEKVRNLAEKKVERPSFKDTVKYYVNMAENNSNLKNSSLSESKYRILAIDGGGVRGAIPSMLLAEVERRAHKPMSSMVNLFAGTSTGAMISACLAMPKHKGSTRPLYSAAETMSFYVNETPFRNPYNLAQMQYYKYKYEDGDRMRVLNGIFRGDGHDRRISEAVCELYIPAMNATATSLVHEFTRHSGKRFTAEDYSIVDVLMATSAAPIYFKPYTMPGSTGGGGQTFLDGGLLAVSPTRRAYEYAVAVHGVDPRSVCALSLGTGDFLDSSLDKERPKGLAYWLGNIAKTIISSTEYDVDLSMRNSLGRERYKRWQVYFERPIRIDEYAYMSYMIDLCEQFIEDNDEAINQVVDLFDTE